MYLVLLALGLLIGAIFLAVLLIGDKREARLAAQQRAALEQRLAAGEEVAGSWPPSPYALALLPTFPERQKKPDLAPGTARNMVRKFYLYRNCLSILAVMTTAIYAWSPRFLVGWVLFIAALGVTILVITLRQRKYRNP